MTIIQRDMNYRQSDGTASARARSPPMAADRIDGCPTNGSASMFPRRPGQEATPLTGWLPRIRRDEFGHVYQPVNSYYDEECLPADRPLFLPGAASHQSAFEISAVPSPHTRANSEAPTKRAMRKAAKSNKRKQAMSEHGSSVHSQQIGLIGFLVQNWMISWMFIAVPLGFFAYHAKMSPVIVFTLNFLAIVPQAWIMGKATEDCAVSAGNIIGGLLNAWFGNIVEMLLCIAGLRQGQLVVVRCTLIGSILSNLLLVTGCSLFAGGMKYKIQQFSAIGASTTSSLLMLGSFCAGLPTMYASIAVNGADEALKMSRVVAFFLVCLYLQYMFFQLNTHSFLYSDDDDDEADMSPWAAGSVLGLCTVMCAFNSEYLISSISGVVSSWTISEEFIGIILLPIIGNAAEHYTSVVVALNNKMDLSLGCAIGSSCQMLLFVTPVTVIVGWICGQPMSLDLHAFEVMILIISVVIITGILQDGYSNWLEGSILCSAYAVIAIVFFFEDPRMSDIL